MWCNLDEKYLRDAKKSHSCYRPMYGFQIKPKVYYICMYQGYLKNLDEEIMDEVKDKIILQSLLEEYSHLVI